MLLEDKKDKEATGVVDCVEKHLSKIVGLCTLSSEQWSQSVDMWGPTWNG